MSQQQEVPKRSTFITEYLKWADTGHAPSKFHLWACLSAIAACLERKVWLPFGSNGFKYYPNIYVFCVAHPGIGKSSAIDRVKNCMIDLRNAELGDVVLVPNTLSVSALVETMSKSTKSQFSGTRVVFEQSAAYFVGGEGSESLSSIHVGGELTNCLTSLYDCQEHWERSTRAHGSEVIRKGCFNMLMGTTFAFLGELLSGSSIMGGFASRGTYVIFDEKFIRPSSGLKNNSYPEGLTESYTKAPRHILEGFSRIHKLRGGFSCEDAFSDSFEEWYPKMQARVNENPSEKMKALLTRQAPLVFKLSMILSAAESSDLILRKHHWDAALLLAEQCEAGLPKMLRGLSNDTNSQKDLVQTVFGCFEKIGDLRNQNDIGKVLIAHGFEPHRYEHTIRMMLNSKMLALQGPNLRLLIDPNEHL